MGLFSLTPAAVFCTAYVMKTEKNSQPPDPSQPKLELTRREFLQRSIAGTAALSLAGTAAAALAPSATATVTTSGTAAGGTGTAGSGMPMRVLGKTGVKVSMLGYGGGSQFLTATPEQGAELLDHALKSGITYFDTAANYGKNRESEKRFGETLQPHRRKIFLTTKSEDRSYDGMMRSIEESLRHLRTDYVDLAQIHAASAKDNPEEWEKPDGALTALRKLRDQKVVRFIGFTGHDNGKVHREIINSLEFDTVLMAINAAGHKGFYEHALPAAVNKNMGIIAMKVTRGLVGDGAGKASVSELLQWTFDLPISVAIIGMGAMDVLEKNLEIAKAYKPSPNKGTQTALMQRLQPHVTDEQLVWALPGYRDGVA